MIAELGSVLERLHPDLRSNVDYVVQDDGEGSYIASWTPKDGRREPTQQEIAEEARKHDFEAEHREKKRKQQQTLDILKLVPAYRQRNMLARSIELLSKRVDALLAAAAVADPLTDAERAEVAAIEELWRQVKEVRQ